MEEKPVQKELTLVKRLDTYNIVIPEDVEAKIRFLCSRVWSTEWSGVLFYKPSGNFEDNTLSIRCVDIFPMDIGSSTYTEFDMSPDVIGYMTDNELLDCQTGLIHSHNNMSTFFSGTDINTLKEEGRDRNHFVSLIVNNAGSYTAAITRKIKYVETRKLSYDTFEGEKVVDAEETFEESEEMEYFPLNICFENKPKDGFQEIAKRLEEIKKAKEEKAKAAPKSTTYQGYSGYSGYQGYSGYGAYKSPTTALGSTTGSPYPSKTEPTLFDKYEDEEEKADLKAYNQSFGVKEDEEEIFSEIPKKTRDKVTDKLIDDLVCQLITGSITMSSNDKFDPVKWASSSMNGLFTKRFGSGMIGLCRFKDWATDLIEYICNCSIETEDNDVTEISFLLANGITEKLNELPKNDFIDIYIDLLQPYAEFI